MSSSAHREGHHKPKDTVLKLWHKSLDTKDFSISAARHLRYAIPHTAAGLAFLRCHSTPSPFPYPGFPRDYLGSRLERRGKEMKVMGHLVSLF